MVWAIVSTCGFTSCYFVAIGLVATLFEPFNQVVRPLFVLRHLLIYILLVVPAVGSAVAITVDWITTAVRRRDLESAGVAAWVAYDRAYDMSRVGRSLPDPLGDLSDFFSGRNFVSDGEGDEDDDKRVLAILAILLAIVLTLAGVLTTSIIIRHTAARYSEHVRTELYVKPG